MIIAVGTLFTILHLISAQRMSKCCDIGSTGGSVLKSMEIVRAKIENVNKKMDIVDMNLFKMQKQVDDLSDRVFPENSCAHLNPIFANWTQYMCGNAPKTFQSCDEALQKTGQSGVYRIELRYSNLKPFRVYCEQTDPHGADKDTDGDWMIVQRRKDGSESFYLGWKEYKKGFGNPNREYFLGLDRLHELTQSKTHELWIKLQDWENETRWAKYSRFAILGERDDYKLDTLGVYSGNAGDALLSHYGQRFSTKDKDNDNIIGQNCAITREGAWWYDNCGDCNLNGNYYKENVTSVKFGSGISWYQWKSNYYSLKYAHMAIRPAT